MSRWKRNSAGVYTRDSYIKRVEIGASGKPLLHIRRPYAGPWALASGDPWIEEVHYAFYDDGTEAGSVIIGTADNQQELTTGVVYFVRFCIENTGTYAYKNLPIQFEYNHEGGGWTAVTTTSSVIKAVDSSNVATGDQCTDRLNGAGSWETPNDGVCEDGVTCGGADLDLSIDYYSNVLLVFQVVAGDVADADQCYIRPVIEQGVTPLDAYAHTGADIDIDKPVSARRIFIC
jgi:hypothetical protein